MATWDATTPDDDTYSMNVIHTQIQNDKAMISERMVCTNSSGIDEHEAADSDDAGKHPLSEVGFVGVGAYADRPDPGIKGALYFDNVNDILYYVDADLEYVRVDLVSHEELDGLDDDDHTDLLLIDGTRPMAGDLDATGATLTITSYGTDNDNALDPAHIAESFYDAHGADKLIGRHFADDVISLSDIPNTNETGTAAALFSLGAATTTVMSFPNTKSSDSIVQFTLVYNAGSPQFGSGLNFTYEYTEIAT